MTTFLSNCNKCSITGNVPHFHISQPPTDVVRFVSLNATIIMTCLLNITMPSDMVVAWFRNGKFLTIDQATVVIENFQPSDVGVYQCRFTEGSINGWALTRNIRLVIGGKFVCTAFYACSY